MPRPALQAPTEAGDEEARQHPRQAGDSTGTRQWDLSDSRAESAAAAGRRGPEARRHQARQHVDPRRRRGVPRDPALCRPEQWSARDWLDALTAPEPGEQVPSQDDHPWNPQARTTTETVLREAMQALWRVHACEDCGGDPHCRHRCRVGTVVYRDVLMLTTPD